MTVISLNPVKEVVEMDAGSILWLTMIRKNAGKSKSCPVPEKYFEVLKAHGYVDGTAGGATLTPSGLAQMIADENSEKEAKKSTKKKTKK